jgi:hypothetical protein
VIAAALLALGGVGMASDCTVRISPGTPIQPLITAGAVLCLEPGRHAGGLFIEVPVTVRGGPGVILDAGGAGAAVLVAGDDIAVQLDGLSLTRGRAEAGGGLRVEGFAEVEARGLHIEGNKATAGGAGVAVHRGRLRLTESRVLDDVLVTGIGRFDAERSSFGGQVLVREAGVLRLGPGAHAGTVDLRATTTRRPTLALDGGVADHVHNDDTLPGVVDGPASAPRARGGGAD